MRVRHIQKSSGLPLMEVREPVLKKVFSHSESSLKGENPGVFMIKKEGILWVGFVEVSRKC